MRLLIDTHTLLWWSAGSEALSLRAREAIADEDNDIFVSAATAWEIATKHRLGKLSGAAAIAVDIGGYVADQGFFELPIGFDHGQAAGALPGPHRDPFDRMLIAQAARENLVLVSNETAFDAYGIKRLW